MFIKKLVAIGLFITLFMVWPGASQVVNAAHETRCNYFSSRANTTRSVVIVDGQSCPPAQAGETGPTAVAIPHAAPDDDDTGEGGGDTGGDSGGGAEDGSDGDVVEATELCEKAIGESQNSKENCDCSSEVGDLNSDNCEIVKYIEIGINTLTGIAGLAIVGGIMSGGFMYMTARDNPGQTGAGRQRVVWALVALLILIFFWGFLQWLVPGGVLENVTGSQFENPS